jgi:hypothetical protein
MLRRLLIEALDGYSVERRQILINQYALPSDTDDPGRDVDTRVCCEI